MEKEIWKWVLDNFPDEGIVGIYQSLDIKIPGFRKVNPQQKNFKLLRQKIIQEALHYKNSETLLYFFKTLSEKHSSLLKFRGTELEEIEKEVEEGLIPSVLFAVLLSSDEEADHQRAEELFAKYKAEDKLDALEKQAVKMLDEGGEVDAELQNSLIKLQEELDEEKQKSASLEKKLKKSEQKNEELKTKNITANASFETEKKKSKEELKALSKEIHTLKGENSQSAVKVEELSAERDSLHKRVEQLSATLKKREDEIARLNALLVKLRTGQEKEEERKEDTQPVLSPAENPKIKVAMIGDPKNSRVQKYNRFDLNIIEAAEINEEKNNQLLKSVEQIWLLTYRTPKGIQKRVKTLIQDKQIHEFANFIDLENFMVKG